jgi:hypothetical protein
VVVGDHTVAILGQRFELRWFVGNKKEARH